VTSDKNDGAVFPYDATNLLGIGCGTMREHGLGLVYGLGKMREFQKRTTEVRETLWTNSLCIALKLGMSLNERQVRMHHLSAARENAIESPSAKPRDHRDDTSWKDPHDEEHGTAQCILGAVAN
jgi:hypothetical protein